MLKLGDIFYYDVNYRLTLYQKFFNEPVFAKYKYRDWHPSNSVNVNSYGFPDVLEYSPLGCWAATKNISRNSTVGYTLYFEKEHDLTMFVLYGLEIDI